MDNGILQNIDEQIKIAVDVREKGDAWSAVERLNETENYILDSINDILKSSPTEAILELREELYIRSAVVLGERFVCLKHNYERNRNGELLEMMETTCQTGLQLPVPSHHLAVFHLRMGDVLTYRGEYEEALNSYYEAYETVQWGSLAEAEYLGHLVGAYSNVGDNYSAITAGEKALELIPNFDLPEWHRLIIVSGIHSRLCVAAWRNKEYKMAIKSFWAYFRIARRLKREFKRPQRWNQLVAQFS